jgi:hypothetical protein
MSVFDGNRDGYLHLYEIADANEFRFADANRDSALTFNEFSRVESNDQPLKSPFRFYRSLFCFD